MLRTNNIKSKSTLKILFMKSLSKIKILKVDKILAYFLKSGTKSRKFGNDNSDKVNNNFIISSSQILSNLVYLFINSQPLFFLFIFAQCLNIYSIFVILYNLSMELIIYY